MRVRIGIDIFSDSKLVENAMRKVAQSTPARSKGSPRTKKIKTEKIGAIPEEPESVEEIPNPTSKEGFGNHFFYFST